MICHSENESEMGRRPLSTGLTANPPEAAEFCRWTFNEETD